MYRKIFAVILVLTLLCTSSFSAFAADTPDQKVEVLTESDVDIVIDSLDKDWYGGVYYEGDTIHIIATEGNAANIQALFKTSRNADPMDTIVVDSTSDRRTSEKVYSITELENAKQELLASSSELGIVAVGVNGKANALAVFLDDYDNVTDLQKDEILAASEVKNILFRDAKVFGFIGADIDEELNSEDSQTAAEPKSLTLYGGQMLSKDNGTRWSTLTTSAVYDWGGSNQMIGFMTCGHGWSVGDSVYRNGTRVGTVRILNQGDDTDFAFVESSYNTHGYMTDGNRLTKRRNPSTGMSIKSYGASSGIQSGSVQDTDIDGEWEEIDFYDLFSTSIPTALGDSGAAYTYNNKYLVGILKGGLGGYSVSVGTKVLNIINGFDVQPST